MIQDLVIEREREDAQELVHLMVVLVDLEVPNPQTHQPFLNVKLLLQLHTGKEEKQDMMDLEVLVEILQSAIARQKTKQVLPMEEVEVESFG